MKVFLSFIFLTLYACSSYGEFNCRFVFLNTKKVLAGESISPLHWMEFQRLYHDFLSTNIFRSYENAPSLESVLSKRQLIDHKEPESAWDPDPRIANGKVLPREFLRDVFQQSPAFEKEFFKLVRKFSEYLMAHNADVTSISVPLAEGKATLELIKSQTVLSPRIQDFAITVNLENGTRVKLSDPRFRTDFRNFLISYLKPDGFDGYYQTSTLHEEQFLREFLDASANGKMMYDLLAKSSPSHGAMGHAVQIALFIKIVNKDSPAFAKTFLSQNTFTILKLFQILDSGRDAGDRFSYIHSFFPIIKHLLPLD